MPKTVLEMLKAIGIGYSRRRRRHRAALLHSWFALGSERTILDLGGGDGGHAHMIWPDHSNIMIADLDPDALLRARDRYGYATIPLDATATLSFVDKEFDLVFCSSVLEHVTGPKAKMIAMTDDKRFKRVASEHQARFADEIKRVANGYWVQTPYKYFMIESHSWLPGLIVFLPRKILLPLLKLFAGFWPKATLPDWNLLTRADMTRLFPGAEIITEYSFGLPKSLIAYQAPDRGSG